MTTILATDRRRVITVHGDRPKHKHLCEEGPHEWECNSPYCDFKDQLCPAHGGFEPVMQGREPWKGR